MQKCYLTLAKINKAAIATSHYQPLFRYWHLSDHCYNTPTILTIRSLIIRKPHIYHYLTILIPLFKYWHLSYHYNNTPASHYTDTSHTPTTWQYWLPLSSGLSYRDQRRFEKWEERKRDGRGLRSRSGPLRGSGVGVRVKEGFTRSRFNRGVEQNPQAALARYKYKYQVVNSMGGGADPSRCFIQNPWKSKKRGRKKIEGKM